MIEGPPLPLSPDLPLSSLLASTRSAEPLGAWVRACVPQLQVYTLPFHTRGRVLASSDLGLLLGRCREIALREGERTTVLPADTVIRWRALQVVTATPHLPGVRRLRAQFPGMRMTVQGILIPIGRHSAEEVLAGCLCEGVRVAGSRVVYLPPAHLPPLCAPP
jgi:hypothetical protein